MPRLWDVTRPLHVEWLEDYIKSHVTQHGFLGLDGLDTQCSDVEKPKDVMLDIHVLLCLCNICQVLGKGFLRIISGYQI